MSKEVSGFISWLRSWFDSIYEIATNKTSNWTNTPNDIRYPSEKLVKDSLDTKSDNGHTHISEDITDISLTSLSEALDKLVQPEIDELNMKRLIIILFQRYNTYVIMGKRLMKQIIIKRITIRGV